MNKNAAIADALGLIFIGIGKLRDAFPQKYFTIDGRLVGDIGEVIAAIEYDFLPYATIQPGHDGHTSNGLRVQVKATFKNSLTFTTVPDYYLGFKLYEDGHYEEIYNGPGQVIFERYSHRKGIGEKLLSFPVRELAKLSAGVRPEDRVTKKVG